MLHTLRRGLTTASPLRAFSALPWSLPPRKPEPCSVHQALADVRGGKLAKFDETIDIAVGLGVDPRKASQNIRGTIELPHGTGKKIRVAVFAEGEDAESALQAGRHTYTYIAPPRALPSRNRRHTESTAPACLSRCRFSSIHVHDAYPPPGPVPLDFYTVYPFAQQLDPGTTRPDLPCLAPCLAPCPAPYPSPRQTPLTYRISPPPLPRSSPPNPTPHRSARRRYGGPRGGHQQREDRL